MENMNYYSNKKLFNQYIEPVNINVNGLMSLGFNSDEIRTLSSLVNNGAKMTKNALIQLGVPSESVSRILKMYDICCGKVYSERVRVDGVKLLSLGFTKREIEYLNNLVGSGVKMNRQSLEQLKVPQAEIKRLLYMYGICSGKNEINSEERLVKHLKNVTNKAFKVDISMLPLGINQEFPRFIVVAGIKEQPYDIWNSNNYKGLNSMIYKANNRTASGITVETVRKPQLVAGSKTELNGILKINGPIAPRENERADLSMYKFLGKPGTKIDESKQRISVTFNSNICKLCNRFIVVVSFKKPGEHHGMCEIICKDGTRVYVYAKTLAGIKNKYTTDRVYAYGIDKNYIIPCIKMVTKEIYNSVYGYKVISFSGNVPFSLLDIPKVEEEDDVTSYATE